MADEARLRLLRLRQAQAKALAGAAQQPPPPTGADAMRARGLSSPDPSAANSAAESAIRPDYRGEGGGRGTSLEAALISARQGVSFGFGDEINAGVRAAGDWLGGKAFGEAYDERLAHERGLLEQVGRENPVTSVVGEIGGAVAPALLTGGASTLPQMGMRGQMALGTALGAGDGAVRGFGNGEGGFAERAGEAGMTALVGGGLGMAAAPVMAALRQGYLAGRDVIGGGVDAVFARGSQSRANRAVAQTLERSGSSIDEVAAALKEAALDGQPEFRVADALGVSGQRRLSGIARAGGDASAEVVDALNARQLDQADRMGGFVRDAFGFNGGPAGRAVGTDIIPEGHVFRETPSEILRRPQTSAAGATDNLRAARGRVADEGYDAARAAAGPVDVRGALDRIEQRLGQLEGSGIIGDGIDARLAQFRARLSAPQKALGPGETARELSDFDRVLGVKQDLQDVIETARRSGSNNAVRELKKIEAELDAALEASSGGYRAANDQFREASRVINAVEQGADMARPGMRAADTTAQFSAMTPDQQAAARLGYGDKMLARTEAAAGAGTNRARPFTSTKAREEAAVMASDPEQFARRIGRENVMFETRNRALGGSRTADNAEDIADLKGFDPSIIPQAIAAPKQAIINLLARSSSTLSGLGPSTRKMVADALMAGDVKALEAAVAQAGTTRERMAIAQALMRLSGTTTGGFGLLEGQPGPH